MRSTKKYENLIIRRFNLKFEKFGNNIKSIGWDNKKNQETRFKNIFKVSNFKDCKNVLDIGCGFGDLSSFIKKHKINIKYTGIDINNQFIEINNNREKKNKYKYYNNSIFEFDKRHDLCVSFGLLNFKKCKLDYIQNFINETFKKSNKASLIDFISCDQKTKRESFIKYHEPEKIIKLVRKITDNFALFSDYKNIPQKEFTIILYK